MLRTLLLLAVLPACDRAPSDPDAGYDPSPGDDDDTVGDDDDDDVVGTPCEVDVDGDGVGACDDCDDDDPTTYPGAEERCDGRDNDCDGAPHPEETSLDCAACDQAGWWHVTRGVQGTDLQDLLSDLTAAQSCFDYSDATDFMFLTLDAVGDEVECVYTGRHTSIAAGKPDATDMNTEHSWPQSLGADVLPAKCDLHHLYPTDADTNNARANLPFGEVVTDTTSIDGGSHLGLDSSGVQVFEPRDAHKGNLARSMLYFATRYGYALSEDELTLYRSWSILDPVDTAELDRTWTIADEQGVANPYVVCPWLVGELTP